MPVIDPTAQVHPTALIGPNVVIGANTYIGPYCVIGFPAEWKGREHEDKGVLIGENVRITGLVTIDSGVEQTTIIDNGCYLMKHSHVGHDAMIFQDCVISCGAKIGGHVTIWPGTNIGLNAVIHQKKVIPSGCMIGMGSVITKGLPMIADSKYAGSPAKYLGPNIKK